MEWTWAIALLATAIVAMGGLLQSVTGLGAGLIIVPLLALISVELVPGPIIFASLALSTSMAVAGRAHLDLANAKPIIVGLLIGTIAGSFLISRLPFEALGILFGIFILIAVLRNSCTERTLLFGFFFGEFCHGTGTFSVEQAHFKEADSLCRDRARSHRTGGGTAGLQACKAQ
jgi:uncharacterized membrane protein YfcA